MRSASADLIVYSHDANGVILRSQVAPETRDAVAGVAGVERVSTFDVALFTGTVKGDQEPVGLALLASDRAISSARPKPGEAYVDDSLRGRAGVEVGRTLLVGPFAVPIKVVGVTHGTNLLFSSGFVVDKETWLSVWGIAPGGDPATAPSQALLVRLDPDRDTGDVAAAIDRATRDETETFTRSAAVKAMPGVKQQEATFGYIRVVTLGVALLVVGLFLSFVTLERAPLYAVMKAVGASSRQLFSGMVFQVLGITDLALYLAALVTWGLTRLLADLPGEMRMSRFIQTAVALRTAALVGAALSLRRVARIDPAEAIG
jgi:putative ABC transport system permease protein